MQHAALELPDLLIRQMLSFQQTGKELAHLALRIILSVEIIQSMIRDAAAHRGKEIMPCAQRLPQVVVSPDLQIRRLTQRGHISRKTGRILNRHQAIGPPGGINLRRQAHRLYPLMIFERVRRIVGRADRLHATFRHNGVGTEVLRPQHLRTGLVDLAGRLRLQDLVDPEDPLQLQVCPMI